MKFDRSKYNCIQYLPMNGDEQIWEMAISGVGFQSIEANESYPLKGHPIGYAFNPGRGRVIDEFAMVYIIQGKGTFVSASCEKKNVAKGDLFFVSPGEWHSYFPDRKTGWDEYWVTFKGAYFERLKDRIFNQKNPVLHVGIGAKIVSCFTEMLDCAKVQQSGFQIVLSGIMMHVIGLVYASQRNRDGETVYMQKIQEACILIRENIFDRVPPEEIARSLNMSYSCFRKTFKQCMGIAPHQYIIQLKISKIKEMLSETDLSVQEISSKMNFESADYFSYFFKRKTGINPLSYRKEIEKQRRKAGQGKDR